MKLLTPIYFLISIFLISLISHGGFDSALSSIISPDLFFSGLTVFTLCILGILALQLNGSDGKWKKLTYGVLWEVGMYSFGIFISVVIATFLQGSDPENKWLPVIIVIASMAMAYLASSNFEDAFRFVDEYVDSKTTKGRAKKIASWLLTLTMLVVIIIYIFLPTILATFFR